jgi:ketosteroid isomerase-like protein
MTAEVPMSDRDTIIAMERTALDRWGAGDPHGYLEIMAPGVSYFDPFQEQRLDGLAALTTLLDSWSGTIKVDRYEMVRPMVQQHGDAALLTFNLVSYRQQPDGTEHPIAHWNSSELYARIDGTWRIVHSHWSFVRPELKESITEAS